MPAPRRHLFLHAVDSGSILCRGQRHHCQRRCLRLVGYARTLDLDRIDLAGVTGDANDGFPRHEVLRAGGKLLGGVLEHLTVPYDVLLPSSGARHSENEAGEGRQASCTLCVHVCVCTC